MKTKLCFLLLMGTFFLKAQNPLVTFENEQPINESKYNDFKGSPYFFDDFVIGNITDKEGVVYENLMLNYNGYEKEFEARRGNKFIIVDDKIIKTVELFPKGKEALSYVFNKNYSATINAKYIILLFQQKKLKLLKAMEVDLNEVTIETPGKTQVNKRFMRRNTYYISENGQFQKIRLKKKNLIQVLDHPKEVEKYIKKEKLKFNSEEELIQLMKFYSNLE